MLKSFKIFLSKHKGFVYFAMLFLSDLLVFYFSLWSAYNIRKSFSFLPCLPNFTFSFKHFLKLFFLPLFFIFFFFQQRCYRVFISFEEEFKTLLKALIYVFIFYFLFISIAKIQNQISRLFLFIFFILLCFFIPLVHYILNNILKSHFFNKKIIFVGYNDSAFLRLKEYLLKTFSPKSSIKIYSFKDEEEKDFILKFLCKTLPNSNTNILILDWRIFSLPEFSKFLVKLRSHLEEIFLFDPKFEFTLLSPQSLPIPQNEFSLFRFKGGLNLLFNLYLKRILDLILFCVFLFPFLILFIIFSFLIKLESPGSVIYKQKRVGKNGKEFFLYKFRTMYQDAEEKLERYLDKHPQRKEEWEKFRKLKNDPRITKIGKFLRRLSLDELPQLFNILKGEMSFIGPRPVTQEELDLYYKDYKELYKDVYPGLTGLWQVSGRNELDYEKRVALDVYYILNWSLLLDFYILLKTIPAVITGKGAY